tara:strand:- start:1134 stop:1589 length:456 start_codon:yes stop_codon:yes gene_type:complete
MQKPFMSLIAFIVFNFSNAQIDETNSEYTVETIGKISTLYKFVELTKQVINDENIYNFTYQNLEFPQMKDMINVRFTATDEELNEMYNKILMSSKMRKNDPIRYIDLPQGRMGLTRLSSGQIKILYTSQGSNEIKWTWLSKGQLKKVFGKN